MKSIKRLLAAFYLCFTHFMVNPKQSSEDRYFGVIPEKKDLFPIFNGLNFRPQFIVFTRQLDFLHYMFYNIFPRERRP